MASISRRNLLLSFATLAIIGAVFTGTVLRSHAATTIAGDINADGKVDIFDLSILLSNFGKTVSGTATPIPTTSTPVATTQPATPPPTTPPLSNSDRVWYPYSYVKNMATGILPDSLVPTPFMAIQRHDATDIQLVNNPMGLKSPDGSTIKMIRLAVNKDDNNVAGSTAARARAGLASPKNLFNYGSHMFFGFGMYVDNGIDHVSGIGSWFGDQANGSGPISMYGKPDPSNSAKGIIRMTRDPAHYSGDDPNIPSKLKNPWSQSVDKGHTYAFLFEIQFSSKFDPNDRFNPYGGWFKVWYSKDGGPYQVSQMATGQDKFDTQTFNETSLTGHYWKGVQTYVGVSELTSADNVINFFVPAMGKTFAAADVLKQ